MRIITRLQRRHIKLLAKINDKGLVSYKSLEPDDPNVDRYHIDEDLALLWSQGLIEWYTDGKESSYEITKIGRWTLPERIVRSKAKSGWVRTQISQLQLDDLRSLSEDLMKVRDPDLGGLTNKGLIRVHDGLVDITLRGYVLLDIAHQLTWKPIMGRSKKVYYYAIVYIKGDEVKV